MEEIFRILYAWVQKKLLLPNKRSVFRSSVFFVRQISPIPTILEIFFIFMITGIIVHWSFL